MICQCVNFRFSRSTVSLTLHFLLIFSLFLKMTSGRPQESKDEQMTEYNHEVDTMDQRSMSDIEEGISQIRERILQEMRNQNIQPVPDAKFKIANISREAVLNAYQDHMQNIRVQRSAERAANKIFLAKERRKNFHTHVQTFFANATDMNLNSSTPAMEAESNRVTFHFDIQEQKPSHKNLRVRRAALNLPENCEPLEDQNELTSAVQRRLSHPKNALQVGAKCTPATSTTSTTTASLHLVMSNPSGAENRPRRHARGGGGAATLLRATLRRLGMNEKVDKKKKKKPSLAHDCSSIKGGDVGKREVCCRRPMQISLPELGLELPDAVIEPKVFDAYMCAGRCSGRRHEFGSTHAMLQQLASRRAGPGGGVPRLCCTPTRLRSLEVIYIGEGPDGTPEIKVTQLKDAIVEECGCS